MERKPRRKLPPAQPRNFDITNVFRGYRNREDPTNLTSGTLVHGSVNVLTNLSDRLSVRPGYTIFGQEYMNNFGVMGSYDLLDSPFTISERHVKSWSTNIDLLWEGFDEESDPVWNTIYASAASPNYNFTNFWDGDTQTQWILGVNGTSSLFAWNTAVAGFASAAATTITKQGTTSWEAEGFDVPAVYTHSVSFVAVSGSAGAKITDASNGFLTAGFQMGQTIVVSGTVSNNGTYIIATATPATLTLVRGQNLVAETVSATLTFTPSISINGTAYSYTGGTSTTTLTGVSPNPTGGAYPVGTMVYQTPHIYNISQMYGMTLPSLSVIAVSASQLFLGSSLLNVVLFSTLSNFFDYTFSLGARLAGQGGKVYFDAPPKALLELDGDVFGSAGKSEWGKIVFSTLAIDVGGTAVTSQSVNIQKIKTSSLSGAISQAGAIAIKNNFAYLSFSNQCLILGKTQFQQSVQTSFFNNDVATDLSYPVLYDFQELDFTDASIFYDPTTEYTLCSFPRSNRVMIFNQAGTSEEQYWESPQLMTVGRFAVIHGEIYFHGFYTPTSYKFFDGLNDDGGAILARAVFSFNMYGKRANKKHTNAMWAEGYIRSNTTLYMTTKFEQVGCGKAYTRTIKGSDAQIVCIGGDSLNPIGQWSQGKQGLGSVEPLAIGNQGLPPAFQVEPTHPPTDFLKQQFIFESNGIDQAWELVAYGANVTLSDKDNNEIKQ